MARFLAFVAAVAMVVAAVVVRARIDHRPGLGSSGGRQAVVCATELADVCDALARQDSSIDVTTEPAGATAARLKSADATRPGLDAWLVPQPWPALVDEARQRASLPPLFEAAPRTLARSPLTMAIWAERAAALSKHCARAVDVRCVAEATIGVSWSKLGGQPVWGDFKPFVADPVQQASGLVATAAATIALTGSTQVSAADLDEDKVSAPLDAFARAIPNPTESSANALHELLTQGPAALDVVLATEAEVGPAVASSSRGATLQVIYPSPVITADLVLARRKGGHAGRIADFVEGDRGKKSLAANGWRVAGIAPIRGINSSALPPGNGLPSTGLLDALQTKWSESR